MDGLLSVLIESGRFRRRAIRALREHRVTLAEWRVLRTLHRVIKEVNDAVSQQEVVRRVGMNHATVSRAVKLLVRRGFVDVGFDPWGWSQRILLTAYGERSLQKLEASVAMATARG